MANRKPAPRAKSKKPRRLIQIDPERWEEIAAIGVLILAALTALGAFNLSGGFLLENWVQLLQALLGWGVYFAPFLLLGLGVWLLLDSLDKIVDLGWERPIGLGLTYLWIVAVLHWLGALDDPLRQPGAFQGGGLLGWAITGLLVQAFGAIGSLFALLMLLGVALILLFNISISELVHRVGSAVRLPASILTEIRKRLPARSAPVPPVPPIRIHAPARETPAPLDPLDLVPPAEREVREPVREPRRPERAPAARIIGEDAPEPVAPVRREYQLPEVREILEESQEQDINEQEIRTKVRVIEETLQHFGVPAQVVEVNQGPTITQFGVEPGFVEQKGIDGKIHRVKVKVSRISALQHDLELALSAAPIRIETPVPGRPVVGIEVPNAQVSLVSLRSVLESEALGKAKSKLRIALGQDVSGQPICADLASMPHLLIAGATGSGKSVCINSIIAALLCKTTPAQVRLVMIDPKRVELVNFNGIPHLVGPVVVDVESAVAALQDAVAEMDRRFKLFAVKSARNVEIYNRLLESQPEEQLPFLVLIVDELADLMMNAPEDVEHAITRLAQMARATGIHLILATQRPSVDVVTGLIKANFPARISFAVTSSTDSRVVLDTSGAEQLLGHGDMLYMASDSSKLLRLQGCFVSDRELDRLVTYWKGFGPPQPLEGGAFARTQGGGDAVGRQMPLWNGEGPSGVKKLEDDLLPQAVEVVQQSKRASISLLQRKLRVGYARAARLIELLEARGIVGPDEGPTKGRAVQRLDRAPTSTPGALPGPAREPEKDDFSDWTEKDWDDLEKD